MYVIAEDRLCGIISVADTMKECSPKAVSDLRGIRTHRVYADSEITDGRRNISGNRQESVKLSLKFCRRIKFLSWRDCKNRKTCYDGRRWY